jgi:hypothetical protein
MSLRTSPQAGVAISCTDVAARDCHVASLLAMTEGDEKWGIYEMIYLKNSEKRENINRNIY